MDTLRQQVHNVQRGSYDAHLLMRTRLLLAAKELLPASADWQGGKLYLSKAARIPTPTWPHPVPRHS